MVIPSVQCQEHAIFPFKRLARPEFSYQPPLRIRPLGAGRYRLPKQAMLPFSSAM